MSQFDDVMGRVSQLVDKTGKFIGSQPATSAPSSPTWSQVASTATAGKQGLGNKFLQGNMNGGDVLSAILGAVNPEEGSEADPEMQAFAHSLGAATGDITKQWQPEELQSAIQQLKGQQLTGDQYKDNAIQMANYLHAKSTGAVVNSPLGGQQ